MLIVEDVCNIALERKPPTHTNNATKYNIEA